ncbi:hypothetical protein [Roseivirga pacifica]|uniref:hypothetical protein n=1 Tax=Roseivirga pacifica TaxID=1267423 RepID=UPI003BAA718F
MNGILWFSSTISENEKVTVKAKGEEGNQVLANRLNLRKISSISDLKFGFKSSRNLGMLLYDWAHNVPEIAAIGPSADLADEVFGANKMKISYLDLGSISTDVTEIEILFDGNTQGNGNATHHFYQVLLQDTPDKWNIYDETADFTEKHLAVRNIYFVGGENLISEAGVIPEIDFQIDLPDDSFTFDLRGALAFTNIFNRIDSVPELKMAEIYRDVFPVPADLRAKVSGQSQGDTLIVVREYIPKSVSKSTLINLQKLTERVEKIETQSPEIAMRYRHSGLTEKSETLEAAKVQLETSAKEDGA